MAESGCLRDTELKFNGWGYKDSYFWVNPANQNHVEFKGNRYLISGQVLPHVRDWMVDQMSIDFNHKTPPTKSAETHNIPQPVVNDKFQQFLTENRLEFTLDGKSRLIRSHGHTVFEIMQLREGNFARIPDVVVFPKCQADVIKIVNMANSCDVCVIPIGGGTSVSSALLCPESEQRSIVSLDMCKMNKLLWIDDVNQTARAEAGVIGQDLEALLNAKGYTLGHEPDSFEFSSLGGWVATRASGMKKNRYGNIEDLLIHVSLVTPTGLLQRSCQVPRLSAGPDINQMILGSEGILGVVTEVTFKIWPLPECKLFGSIVFPNFDSGVKCLREVAKLRIAPASIRLVDNEQLKFAQALKPVAHSYANWLAEKLKKLYVTHWKGYCIDEMCVATLVFEGTKEDCERDEKRLYTVAAKYGGIPGGSENGQRGYMLTFSIAYLRDLGFEYGCLGESFETAVPWDKVELVCGNVKRLLKQKCLEAGVPYPPFASCRVTQLYDSGVCLYFYFGFNYRGLKADPLHVYEEIEEAARREIMALGGSVSHHHGIGKLRKQFLPATITQAGMSTLGAIKAQLDPKNIFGAANLFTVSRL